MSTSSWRRTEFAVIAAVFLYFAGTSFVVPFLPLYIQELEDADTATTAIWAGVILGAAPFVSGVVAPIWGRMSDRFGRKVLLQRSLIGFTICLGLMAIAQSAPQLLVIRALMGLVGGFTVTAQSLVAVGAPRASVTSAIGRANAARVLGMAIGPLPGGLLADAVGIRWACIASVAGGAIALVIVSALVTVPGRVQPVAHAPAARPRILTSGFVALLTVVTTVRLVEKSFDPVLPLVIQAVADRPFGPATATAIVVSSGLAAAAIGSAVAGRLEGVGGSAQRRNLGLLLVAAGVLTTMAYLSSSWWMILVSVALAGFALGAAASLAISQVALATPADRRGTAFGVVGSGTAFGSAAGLVGAGILGAILLPAVFLLDSVLLVAASALQWLRGPRDDAEEEGSPAPA